MLCSIQVLLFKLHNGLFADPAEGQEHVKGMKAGRVYIHVGGDAGSFQVVYKGQGLAVEGFAG